MAGKGAPRTGGRQKGTPNKASVERQAKIEASGLTPLDYTLGILRDEESTKADRMWAAHEAAPYVHPKLQSVFVGGSKDPDAVPIDVRIVDRELARRIALILDKADKEKE